MQYLQTGGEVQSNDLLVEIRSLADYPFEGAMADTRADALALLYFFTLQSGSGSENLPERDEVPGEYRTALSIRPNDGYLWARYGLFLAGVDSGDFQPGVQQALKQALALSPRDYNTMRILADLGMQYWPELDCAERRLLVVMLENAESVDDGILSRWNTVHGQLPIGAYLQDLYARHGFSLRWAKINTLNCRGAG